MMSQIDQPSSSSETTRRFRFRSATKPLASYQAINEPELGLLFLLCMPMLAAVSSFKDVYIGGMNYQVPITLFTPLCILALVLAKACFAPVRLCTWPGHTAWLLWFGLVWCSLFWCQDLKTENIKHAFEMSTPYLFGLAGAMFIQRERELRWLMNAMVLSLIPTTLCTMTYLFGIVDGGEFTVGPALDLRPHSMSLLPIAALAIACLPESWALPILFWSVCLLLSAAEGSRGVTLAILVLPMFHPGYKGLKWRLLLLIIILIMGLIVFYLPAMQQRLFPETGSGSISDLFTSKQSGMGRFEAWPLIFEKALEAPILGHGVASAFDYVPTIWDRMRSPHNEFLCIGYEFGLVGLLIYLFVMRYQMKYLTLGLKTSKGPIRVALATVYLGLIAFNIMALTDNPLSSNVRFLNPLFLVLGAAYSCANPKPPVTKANIQISYVK